jgi:hypothetical protein
LLLGISTRRLGVSTLGLSLLIAADLAKEEVLTRLTEKKTR